MQIIKKDEANTKVLINKGIAEQKLELWAQSFDSFQYVVNLQLEDDFVYTSQGLCLFKQQEYKLADLKLTNAIKLNPLNFKALLLKAQISQASKQYPKAIIICDTLLNSTNLYKECALFCKGYCLLEQQQYNKANDCFEEILNLNPFHKEAKLNQIEALEGIQNFEKALQRCEECIQIMGSNCGTDLLSHKGYCLQCLNRHSEAIQCFQNILLQDPLNKVAEENCNFSQEQLEN